MSRIEQIESIFHEARTMPPGPARTAWVDEQCAGDPELSSEVLSLLHAHAEVSMAAQSPVLPQVDIPSARFGAYEAIERVGRGGTSIVYRARRADGRFNQTVALKILAAYLTGPEFLRRFETERQVLATLNHHNITSLLDGGVSSSGDPYLITEYVDGVTIDRYCDEKKLGIEERLRLFLQVCEAVDYAHRHLVVHRDLKPGNILVNSEGMVKLLDFGTASMVAAGGDVTVTRMRMLTPRYASPEQLRGERVSTATDIFSLGVVLYELITGSWPYGDPTSIRVELARATSDMDAKSPSMVITQEAAERRSETHEHLRRLMRGDLATIALKMLASNSAARYESVRQVSDDIQRYLEGRPVLARPHTAWYTAGKFIRRHWMGASAATAGILALAALTVFSMYQSAQARMHARRAEKVSQFAKNTFLSASSTWTSPLSGQSRAIQFVDILDNASQRVGKALGDDPVAEADMRGTLGSTYSILGETEKGAAQIRLALERLKQAGNPSPEVAFDLHWKLCNTLSYQGKYGEAVAACREAIAGHEANRSPYPLGYLLHDTAFMLLKSGGAFEEAERMFRDALKSPPSDAAQMKVWPFLVTTRIGALRSRLGDLAEGERILKESEDILRRQPGPLIEIIPTLVARAYVARVQGRYDEGVRLLTESMNLLIERPTPYMGPDTVEIELAAARALAGKPQPWKDVRELEERLKDANGAVDRLRYGLLEGIVEAHGGSLESAESYYRSALQIGEKELPRQPADRVEIYVRLAELLGSLKREAEAREVAREGLRVAEFAYGRFFATHPLVAELRKQLR